MSTKKKLKIVVASTIYGYEDQLIAICAQLNNYGYDVLNSHIGSILANPSESNLKNCLAAVEECDVFLGIIRPTYGSGVLKEGELSITHQEIKKSIELKKARWFLVNRDVVFARQLLKKVSYVYNFEEKTTGIKVIPSSFFDKRSIDIYEEVIQTKVPAAERIGHWAQEFYRFDEIMAYIKSQFLSVEKVRTIVEKMNLLK